MLIRRNYYNKMLKYWDSRAISYNKEESPITSEILKILRKNKCRNILEIGCGPGYDAIFWIKNLNNCQVTCLDFSSEMITRAKRNIERAELFGKSKFITSNIIDVHFNKESFDGVIARSVLHHLFSKQDIELACKKILDSLKVKGVFILVENWANPSPTEFENQAFLLIDQIRKLRGIKGTFLKQANYQKLLKHTGFKQIKSDFIKEKIYLKKYALNKNLKKRIEKFEYSFSTPSVKTLLIVARK